MKYFHFYEPKVALFESSTGWSFHLNVFVGGFKQIFDLDIFIENKARVHSIRERDLDIFIENKARVHSIRERKVSDQ